MRIVPDWVRDVGEAEHIQLLLSTTASRIDREQDWPCDATSHETNNGKHAKEPKIEVPVERPMAQHVAVIELPELANPASLLRCRWRLLAVRHVSTRLSLHADLTYLSSNAS